MAEDRLRKLTPENRELANNLRHEVLELQRAARAQPPPSKKKPQGSVRDSEERLVPAQSNGPRGQKRVRDQELEKVSTQRLPSRPHVSELPALPEFCCTTVCLGLPLTLL